jgi:ABC-type Mn2+/Zn2+ transport system ATPase subunit
MSSALSIRQLTKTYGNGFQALSGIDLDVAEGDFFALLGPNGAGKSTTIGILSTLVNKTSGTVNIFGHDLDKDPAALKRCIGVVPQEFNFNQFEKTFDIVVTQAGYYGIPAKIAKERAEQYLTQLGLWDKRDVPSRSLSGGMKRRLMIARALVHEPRLLILDEPTAGVDIELRRSMWTFLTELNKKASPSSSPRTIWKRLSSCAATSASSTTAPSSRTPACAVARPIACGNLPAGPEEQSERATAADRLSVTVARRPHPGGPGRQEHGHHCVVHSTGTAEHRSAEPA